MIVLKAKCGLVISFKMASETDEINLVERWKLGTVKDSTILKLGKYGQIKVGDIALLDWVNRK